MPSTPRFLEEFTGRSGDDQVTSARLPHPLSDSVRACWWCGRRPATADLAGPTNAADSSRSVPLPEASSSVLEECRRSRPGDPAGARRRHRQVRRAGSVLARLRARRVSTPALTVTQTTFRNEDESPDAGCGGLSQAGTVLPPRDPTFKTQGRRYSLPDSSWQYVPGVESTVGQVAAAAGSSVGSSWMLTKKSTDVPSTVMPGSAPNS